MRPTRRWKARSRRHCCRRRRSYRLFSKLETSFTSLGLNGLREISTSGEAEFPALKCLINHDKMPLPCHSRRKPIKVAAGAGGQGMAIIGWECLARERAVITCRSSNAITRGRGDDHDLEKRRHRLPPPRRRPSNAHFSGDHGRGRFLRYCQWNWKEGRSRTSVDRSVDFSCQKLSAIPISPSYDR